MKDVHRASHDALVAADAWRVFQCDGKSLQSARFNIDAHLAVLVAHVAVDALPWFGCDSELRPSAPKVHPKGKRAPHATPNTLAKKGIQPDRDRASQTSADP